MQKLIRGVERFRRTEYPIQKGLFEQLASKQQRPTALFITCSDSRVNPNLITQTEPGDLFLVRNAGNLVPSYGSGNGGEAATIEYSVEVLGIRDIVICGHSQCGAIRALLSSEGLDHVPAVRAWCSHAEATRRIVRKKYRDLPEPELSVVAAEENVLVQMNNLSTHPCVAARLSSGELKVYGWYYDIGSGRVLQYDQSRGHFFDLDGEAYEAHMMPVRAVRGATAEVA
jgi:carbonic anhydrase